MVQSNDPKLTICVNAKKFLSEWGDIVLILLLRSYALHFMVIGAFANKFASTYYHKITPTVLRKSKTINYDYDHNHN